MNDSRMLVWLYRANIAGACFYALLTLYEASTYMLFAPHAVGHVFAMAGVLIGMWWCIHGLLLAAPLWSRLVRSDRWLPVLPALIVVAAALVTWANYRVQWYGALML
jgi:hypothetical protein